MLLTGLLTTLKMIILPDNDDKSEIAAAVTSCGVCHPSDVEAAAARRENYLWTFMRKQENKHNQKDKKTRWQKWQKDKMRIYYISGTVLALVGWTLLSLSRMNRWQFGREVGGMNWNQCKMRGKDYLDLKNKKCFFFPGLCPGGPGSQLHHLWWRSWRRCQGVWLSS